MLAKQGLKSKYFHNEDFLDTNVGHNPSLCLKSTWTSRVVLKDGYKWTLGDGSNVNMWFVPWLRKKDNLRLTSILIQETF